MLCLGFGEKITIDRNKQQIEVCKYRLHIQCPWRIVNPEKKQISLACYDIYEPTKEEQETEEFDWQVFNWDSFGKNLFDQKAASWFDMIVNPKVGDICIDEWNDLKITFSSGDILETFIASSFEAENWRLFETCKEEDEGIHLVAYKKEICLE